MADIERWTIYWPENLERDPAFVGNGPGEPLYADEQPGYRRFEVVEASHLEGAVEALRELRDAGRNLHTTVDHVPHRG